jgi:hypothetical protein
MALTLSQIGIETTNTVEAWHVTQSIDAFTGAEAYDITLSGSLTLQNGTEGADRVAVSNGFGEISFTDSITASLQGTASYADSASYTNSASYALTASYALSSSYAVTASYANTTTSASYALTASYLEGNTSDLGTTPLTVVVATTAVLPFSPVYNNGPLNDGIGSFLSGSSNGALGTIDGTLTALNDRILVKNQVSQLQNGVYELIQTGSSVAKYILTRTTDANDSNDFDPQVVIPSTGSTQAGLIYAQTTNSPIIGADNIVYSLITTNTYVTQTTAGTQNQFQIPWWNTTARQLSKGVSNFRFNGTALITSGSLIATGSATFIKNDAGAQSVLTAINTHAGASRFISHYARTSGSVSTLYTHRKITNGGIDQDSNADFGQWVSDVILETTGIGTGTTANITYTKGWKWGNYNGGNYGTLMVLMASGSMQGGLGLGVVPSYQLELSTDLAAKFASTTWTVTSDERLKTNIEEANYDTCYNIVKNLPLKRYTWKDEACTIEQVKDRSKLGWIAQEVETVFPKAVDTRIFSGSGELYLEDCKSLNADQIYAAMYGTIKKLIVENEELKSEIQTIKTHLGI